MKNRVEQLRSPRIKLSLGFWNNTLTGLSLAFVFVVAVIARLGPLKYAFQIAEVDPWFFYYSAHYMLTNGVAAWFHFVNPLQFYPYGLNVPYHDSPMLGMFSIGVYFFVRMLGINISFYQLAVVIPVVVTAATSVMMYPLGKEIGGRKVGLLAALFLAVSPANIQQTMLGEFKDEFISFFFLVPSLYFMVRSLRTKRGLDMLISGVLLSFAVASWGPVSAYMYDMVALVVLVTVITRRITPNIGLKMLALIVAPAILTASMIPQDVGGVTHLGGIAPVGAVLVFTVLMKYYRTLGSDAKQIFKSVMVIVFALLVVGSAVLLHSSLGGRILAIVNPFTRSLQPIVNTVAENSLTTWYDFYVGFNIQMLLLPVGAYMFYKRKDAVGALVLLYILTSVYATASYVRAEELLTPFAAIAAAYVLAKLIETYSPMVVKAYRSGASRGETVDWEVGGILLVLLVATVGFYAYQGVASSNQPPLMLVVGNHISQDWPAALTWLKYNTPSNAVVASWWDYGYWILTGADRATLADPSTVNTTQIQYLAVALMSNSTVALKIFEFYHVDYLLIYQPIATAQGFEFPSSDGDFYKSGAMLTIAASTNFQKFNKVFGLNLSKSLYSNTTDYFTQLSNGLLVPAGLYAGQSTLYNLIFGSNPAMQYSLSQLSSGQVAMPTFSVPQGFTLVYQTPDGAISIYQVNYNTTSSQALA
ncbi:MAG: STT3 domain-containing protein [Thermoprotei archaeon]